MRVTMFGPLRLLVLLSIVYVAHCQISGSLYRRNTTGLTNTVTWDANSLFVHGQRIFVLSAEVHPWRLPNPNLWADVLQKVRANGFNTVSFYVNWALHYPTPDTNRSNGDFESGTYRDIQRFIDEAKKAGLWLIARYGCVFRHSGFSQLGLRPGPYISEYHLIARTPSLMVQKSRW